MKTKSYFILVLCACFVSLQSLFAQEVLTLSDALKLALENNYSILIAKNEAE
ncbi:MAG: TolC family protein, partial [Bacteroidia bacterium]|nr:TolC family protein [Bacteroidia bacterium]